jgi:hypothetical protein
MMLIRSGLASTAVSMLLTGCGPGSTSVPPKIAERADVLITFDGKRHACVVSLYNEPQGSAVPCGDIVPFLKDELRLPTGAIYDTNTVSSFDQAEMARVGGSLKSAGFRFIGGKSPPF